MLCLLDREQFRDFERNGVRMGHYFIEDYASAKRDFAARAGLINEQRLFSDKELGVIRNACEFALTDDATLTYGDEKRLRSVQEQIDMLLQGGRSRKWNRRCNILQRAGVSF